MAVFQTSVPPRGGVRRRLIALAAGSVLAVGGLTLFTAPAHAAGGRLAYVSTSAGSVSALDTVSDTVVATITVSGAGAMAENVSGSKVYVGSAHGVAVIDTARNVVTSYISGFSGPSGIAVDPANGLAYVADEGGASVVVFSTVTDAIVGSPIHVGRQPYRVTVSPDGIRLLLDVPRNASGGTDYWVDAVFMS